MDAQDSLSAWPTSRRETPALSGRGERTEPLVLIQVLRAIAALLVLVGHTQGEVVRVAAAHGQNLAPLPFLPGGFGVDLFFCISGFVMVVSSARLFATTGARGIFLRRRAFRLVPLYWLVTICYVPLLMLGSHGYQGDLPRALATSLAFIPYPSYGADGALVFPLYSLGWTLNYEVFFYLVFSLFIVLPARRAGMAVCVALSLVVIAGVSFSSDAAALRFWSQPIILEFGFGVIAGYAWLRGRRLGGAAAATLIAAALAYVLADPFGLSIKIDGASTQNDFLRVLGWGLPTWVLLVAAVLFERHRSIDLKFLSFVAFLGDCSYSLYLVHPFALLLITKGWLGLQLERYLDWKILGVALIGGSIGLSIVSYRRIERPLTSWLNGRAVYRR